MIGNTHTRRAWLRHWLAACGLAPMLQPDADLPGRRAITLTARKFTFDPDVIDVRHNDVVRLTITSADIAHSFTVDAYRIQKRIPPGGTVTFEFRADEVGRFPFYCSLRADPGCAEMRGELIVR
jgi:cytochrome c oxidase subunit 2